MLREGKFGVQETVCFTTIAITAKVFFSSPTYVVQIVGTAGWLMTLISAFTTGAAFFFVYRLLRLFPGKNIIEINTYVLGNVIGSVFSILLSFILFVTATLNLREFTEVINVYVLPSSPPDFILYLFITVLIILSFLGLETLVRFSKLMAYILLAGFLIIIILSIKYFDLSNMFPFFGHGFNETFINGIKRSSAYGEIMIIAVIAKSLQGIKYVKKASIATLILTGCIVTLSLLSFSLTFPYYVGQEITAPIYLLSSIIEYGDFFQRVESLFLLVWIICSVISITASFYGSLFINSFILSLNDKKPLIIPCAIILTILAMLPQNITQVLYAVQLMRSFNWILFYVPSLIVLSVAKIRHMLKGEEHAQ
jgi:spore germination protein (amino acid permease)